MFSYCVPGQRRRNSGLVRRTQAQGGLASFQVLTNGPMVTRSNSRRKSCIYIHRVTRNCTWACVVGTVLSCGLSVGQSAKPGAVDVWMHNIQYHYSPQIAAHIQQLRGQFVPTKPGGMPVFDDAQSFTLEMKYAEIAISADSLANVLNQNVFNASDAQLKKLAITTEGTTLKIKGRLHSKGDLPFETDGTLSTTSDGKIRLHATKIKAAKLPVKGVMDLLGLKIQNLISTKKVSGVQAEGDDLILDATEILPPPKISGRVTQVRVQGSDIIEIFGDAADGGKDPGIKGNYMAYRGAQLRFGKLTMTDTDMILIDMNPADPFDFYLDHYKEQLAAGYSKTTMDSGLRVYMRDYNKLGQPKSHK